MKIGVYGSLREGEWNFDYFLKGKKCLGVITIKGLMMYNLGMYPCVVNTNNNKDTVVMEVYELDDTKDKETIASINAMEFGAGYVIKSLNTEFGKVLYYAYKSHPQYGTHIESGDWVKYNSGK